MSRPRFHLCISGLGFRGHAVLYCELLGASVGREAPRWIDFDFWGHQLSAHLVDEVEQVSTNAVDGESVPARHFGVILTMETWRALRDRLVAAEVSFIIAPQIRFEGQTGEQATLFLSDPSGNALEFKAFASDTQVFARESQPA